jgi:hypothetical protein
MYLTEDEDEKDDHPEPEPPLLKKRPERKIVWQTADDSEIPLLSLVASPSPPLRRKMTLCTMTMFCLGILSLTLSPIVIYSYQN